MTISEQYRKLNKDLHEQGSYGRKGDKWTGRVRELIQQYEPGTILDYGCGQGALGRALGMPIQEYDPAIEGKDKPPTKADLVVCTDVLEHIEPEQLDAVLNDLHRVTGKCLFAVISTRPAKKVLADGRNAHLIVEDWSFWEQRLSSRFQIGERSENHKEVDVVLVPL